MTRLRQVALIVIAFSTGLVGLWATAAPKSFYEDFPGAGRVWVAVDGPYNEHLVRDVGAGTLALGVALVLAAWWLDRRVVITAVVAFLTFTVPHTVFHSLHLEHFPPVDAVLQQTGFLVEIVLAVAVLVLVARDRRAAELTAPR
jgi:hypothetical protein